MSRHLFSLTVATLLLVGPRPASAQGGLLWLAAAHTGPIGGRTPWRLTHRDPRGDTDLFLALPTDDSENTSLPLVLRADPTQNPAPFLGALARMAHLPAVGAQVGPTDSLALEYRHEGRGLSLTADSSGFSSEPGPWEVYTLVFPEGGEILLALDDPDARAIVFLPVIDDSPTGQADIQLFFSLVGLWHHPQ